MSSETKPRRASKKKRSLADLESQPDPRAPLDAALFVAALQPLRKLLEDDLLARAKASPAIQRALDQRHKAEKEADRTADAFAVWQRRFVEQVAAAWILSAVFVRTLEDRGLLESARIAGPGALDAQRTFLQLAPSLSEREYLLTVFREMTRLPAAAGLFDAHNPVWVLAPSAEGAKALLALFRAGGDEAPSLRFGQPDTRFLGDLYQDLNESVRERYALLQTPDFVERFILERTLEPAIEKFGLDDTDLIDPTCGSGHFLLGAFDRLFARRLREAPGLDPRQAAHDALDHVYGADINPYAVAIARFRLTLSYLEKAGFKKLSEAPKLPLHVAVADSLLYNPQHEQRDFAFLPGLEAIYERRAFDLEDAAEAREVLDRQYAAVVGNPPYITVKDKALRDRYRKLYSSAHREYSLSVPFAERFFQLARAGGRVGQITANSFMKREFGTKLIEEYLPTVNLDLIVNTSGAYIPGHGTPTVLLFGTSETPQKPKVLAVLAKRGEPSTPDDPARGHVWSSIVDHVEEVGFDNDYISVAEVDRESLKQHPWSLAGGGAGDLKALLEERAEKTLGEMVRLIGFGAVTREDEVFAVPIGTGERWGIDPGCVLPYGNGECVRDWGFTHAADIVFPYNEAGTVPSDQLGRWARVLWQYRPQLWLRQGKGFKTKRDAGGEFYEYSMFYPDRHFGKYRIAFAFVATHNHFVLDRGDKVFNRSAPIIKLPEKATEEDHLALLAYLNSSTACFWMKQVFYPKSSQRDLGDGRSKPESLHYEFAGTGLQPLPVPRFTEVQRSTAIAIAKEALELAAQRELLSGLDFVSRVAAGQEDASIAGVEAERDALLGRLVVLQEDLDWLVYSAFSLTDRFERSTIRQADADVRPFTGIAGVLEPVWKQRSEAVARSKELRLLEHPVYKRLWSGRRGVFGHGATTFGEDVATAAADWLQAETERHLERDASARSIGAIASTLAERRDATRVLSLIAETDHVRACRDVLANGEAVPYLAAYRYTDKGMEKRAAWEHTWELQRREDAGEKIADIPVPPKYDPKDFRSASFYRLRGKLDVPKERFISYPGCESDEDGEPVYGWAGWDHAQRAQALVALYDDRKTREGWSKERLLPMLAGVLELLPWLKQWHSLPMPDYDTTFAEAYAAFLDTELRAHALTPDDLRAWRPPEKKNKRKR